LRDAVCTRKSPSSEFINAPADKMPVSSESLAGAFSCLAVHHFEDLEAMAREVYRVLEPNVRFVIFTAAPSQTCTFWLNEYFGEMMRSGDPGCHP
jgi:ubiquinone/menaquinone biosynthesis C-methylase UbiE